MADDLHHPDDRPDPGERFRADLAGSLRGLPGPELADLLAGLPDPVTIDLIAALAARGPAHARLPDTWPGHPDSEFMRRRSLREVVADRCAARAARRSTPAAPLAEPGADRWVTEWLARRLARAVAERRLAEALRRPAPPLRLTEAQAIPAGLLLGFAEGLLDHRAELLRQGQPATAARALAVTEALQTFRTGAGARGWTVDEQRLTSLARDVLGLEEEYRDRHGYPPDQARAATFREVLEGERARGEQRGQDRDDR